jgi:protein O-GlcNAc transferase
MLGCEDMSRSNRGGAFRQPKQTTPLDASDIGNVLCQAVRLHQQGQLARAESLYRTVLKRAPNHFDARHLLGLIEYQRNNFAAATRLISQALQVDAKSAPAHANLGNALRELKRHAEALACYDRALAIRPDYANAFSNRGNVLFELKRHEEALASYDRAVAIEPDFAEAYYNRGNVLRELRRHDEALASYGQALASKPSYAEALSNRGNVLLELERPMEALASYDRALAIKPQYAEALNNRGNALLELKRAEEALASYDRALAIEPDDAKTLYHRGNALLELRRYEEALASYHRALVIKPDFALALSNRGSALLELYRYEEGIEEFERLLRINPDFDYAKGELLYAKLSCCDWYDYNRNVELIVKDVVAGRRAASPFTFLAVSDSPSAQLQCAQTHGRDKYAASAHPIWKGQRYRHDRIHVAYLSADFHDHATAYLIAGLIEAHDKSRFETIAISFGPDKRDKFRTRLTNSFARFIDVRHKSDRDTALLLRDLEIDIAVDLKGDTQGRRTKIFAFRPAPIQVNYLGYPGTMGVEYIDYILADRIIIPVDQHCCYTEKVVYLPDTYQPNDSKRSISENTPTRAEAGLPETGFVFCSFNNNYKIAPSVFDVWIRLLHQVPGSVLWLLEGNAAAVRNLRQTAERRGVAPDRLVFAPHMQLQDHLARHCLADFFLDTLPYNAHTTASDALWAGLPIVTCLGSSFAGRVAASLLHAVGLPELITDNLEDYEALALKLARDKNLLAAIRAKLAQNKETFPLFDTDRFRRHIESGYQTMWERYQQGLPPASFAVAQSGG